MVEVSSWYPVVVHETSLVFWWRVIESIPSHFTWNQKITQHSSSVFCNWAIEEVLFMWSSFKMSNIGKWRFPHKAKQVNLFASGLYIIYVVSYGVCSLHIQLHRNKSSVCLLRWSCRRWRHVVWNGNSKAGLMPFYLSVEIAWFHSKL